MERVKWIIPILLVLSLVPGISSAVNDRENTRLATAGSVRMESGASAVTPSVTPPNANEYQIGPHDLLSVKVFRVEDFDVKVRVDSRGDISLPLIGSVHAAGRTSSELEQEVASKLAEDYLQNPYVTVFVEEYASQHVTVVGAVNKPGVYPLTGPTTLLQAIALAQGLDNLADLSRVQVLRNAGQDSSGPANYDIESIRVGKKIDPQIRAGDIVVVSKSGGRSILKGVTDTLRGFVYFGRIP